MSPVKAPLATGWQSWAPRLSSPPLILQAACASSVAGGQTSSSARPDSPASAACRMASISAKDPDRPFIFQLPATNGRTPGVIQASPASRRARLLSSALPPMQNMQASLDRARSRFKPRSMIAADAVGDRVYSSGLQPRSRIAADAVRRVSGRTPVYQRALDRVYSGKSDGRTETATCSNRCATRLRGSSARRS